MKKMKVLKKMSVFVLILCMMVTITGCKKEPEEITGQPEPTKAESDEGTKSANGGDEKENEVTQPADQEATLTSAIYEYVIINEGKEYMNYLHFYDNGVWYYSKYNNGMYQAGYYTVSEENFDIVSTGNEYTTGDEVMKSCANKITFYDTDGKTIVGECGYTDIDTMIGVTIHGGRDFVQNLESTHTSDDEIGVNMAEYLIEDDEYSMVAFKHNGTYQDTIGMMISGKWEKEGDVYTMTNAVTEAEYTLTDHGDGTAAYVAEDGTEVVLVAPVEKVVQLEFSGSTEGAYGELTGTIACYDDGSLQLVILYVGNEQGYEGTWELAADYSKVTISIEDVEYEAPRAEDNSFSFEYTTTDGTQDIAVRFSTGEGEEASISYVFTGSENDKITMECYSDNTCDLIYEGMGVVTSGTWSVDTSGALPAWDVKLEETFEDEDIVVETDYQTQFYFTYKNNSGQLEEILVLTFEEYQAGND